MHTHWINRNYKYRDQQREYTGSILKHGEVHWHYDPTYTKRGEGSFVWHWGTTFCHASVELGGGDGNDELKLSLGLPWILAVWFHHTLPRWIVRRLPQHYYRIPHWNRETHAVEGYDEGSYPEKRSIDLRIHSWALWWTLWFNDDEWHSTDPWWRRGSFHLDDTVLGRRQYTCENIGPPRALTVGMLEGDYPVTAQQRYQRWWRPRWPWWPFCMERRSFDIRCEVGIPFPGKGENSWDCGDDGLFGTAFEVDSAEEGCLRFRDVVLEYRKRYGGARCATEAWPEAPADRIRQYHERVAAHAQESLQAKQQPST